MGGGVQGVGERVGRETIEDLCICSLNILTMWGKRGWSFRGWQGSVVSGRRKDKRGSSEDRQYRDI